MKYILLVLDGLGDRPFPDGKTPLQAAKTPNLDDLAHEGINGLMNPISPGIPAGSDTSHLSLLGYNPYEVYGGRGPLEALGSGVKVKPGDFAMRANFATVNDKGIIVDRRAGRIKGDLSELETALNKIKLGIPFEFKHTVDHRGVFILKGKGKKYSSIVSDSDPHQGKVLINEVKALDKSAAAKKTAQLVNKFSKKAVKILSKLDFNKKRKKPANAILLRGAGVLGKVDSFEEKWELNGAAIAATALVKGVSNFVGLDVLDVPGATGNEKTSVENKFKAAVKALEDNDFCLVNIKATDNFGHDGDFEGKKKMIEKIDKYIPILTTGLRHYNGTLAVTGDHSTPVHAEEHTGDPVPIVVWGPTVRTDKVEHFNEIDCAEGGLHTISGRDITPMLRNYCGRADLFGA